MPSINSNPQPSIDKLANKQNTSAPKTDSAKPADTTNQKSGEDKEVNTQKTSTAEKVALGAAVGALGGAVAYVALIDGVSEKAQSLGKKAVDSVKEHYKHPPEEKMAEQIKKGLSKAGDAIEEFVDDVKDGRIARDINKSAKRMWRDNFTDQTKLEKVTNKVKDAAEDLADAAADAVDDIKDGRAGKKLKKALED